MNIFGWVPDLVSAWASGSPTIWIISAALFCLEVVASGITFRAMDEDFFDSIGIIAGLLLGSFVIALFWPFFLIAAGPIAVVAGLFIFGGRVAERFEGKF